MFGESSILDSYLKSKVSNNVADSWLARLVEKVVDIRKIILIVTEFCHFTAFRLVRGVLGVLVSTTRLLPYAVLQDLR